MNSYFRQLLLEKRRQQLLKAGRKVPWKLNKMPAWTYPRNLERSYCRQVEAMMKPFARASAVWVRDNVPRLIQEQKARHQDGQRQDAIQDDMASYKGAFHEVQLAEFGPTSQGFTAKILSMGNSVASFGKRQWAKIMGSILGHSYYPAEPWLAEATGEWAATNHTLIKSLSEEYITKSNILLQEGILGGQTYTQLTESLMRLNRNLTLNRARLIASDQIGKLNGRLAMLRQTDAGITMYNWETAGDERVRDIHRTLDHKICKWSNPDVYLSGKEWVPRTAYMERASPGYPIRCRCIGLPYMEPMLLDIDRELAGDPELSGIFA